MRYRLRTLMIVLALACLVSRTIADDSASELAKKELEKLQGQWVLVYWRVNGKDLDAGKELGESGDETTITFSGNRFVVKVGQKVYEEGTAVVDPSAAPATFDCVSTVKEGRKDKISGMGIYLLKDALFIACMSYNGSRPVVFSAEHNSPHELVIYRRK